MFSPNGDSPLDSDVLFPGVGCEKQELDETIVDTAYYSYTYRGENNRENEQD